ncbi:MAG TPA: hypothetical protein VF384_07215 [Planctomycetota bacterium]
MLELLFAVVIVPLVLGIGTMTLHSSCKLATDVMESSSSVDKLREMLRRIGEDLTCSSQTGEDVNANGILDEGEDLNGNGRLEKDWAVTPTSVRFNRVLRDGTFSLPITYSLQGGRLMRSKMVAGGATETASVAGRVLAFSVLASGTQMTVSMSVGSSEAPQSSSVSVHQRN